MKVLFFIITLGLITAAGFAATTASVNFTDGNVKLKPANGMARDLQIGDTLKSGDSIQTGKDGSAELDQNGVTLKVGKSTVFILNEKEQNGQKRSVVQVALGSVKMKYDKLTGQEPLIRTAAAQCGVRGTELTVSSGEDGSTLIAVDKGQVDVSAEGKTVALVAGEGVEVNPGQAPGIKFTIDRSQTDYSKWNDDKVKNMLADPVAALAAIKKQMDTSVKLVADYNAAVNDYALRLDTARKKFQEIFDREGLEKAKIFQKESVDPIEQVYTNLNVNKRFESISAMLLRRYVAGRLNVLLKPQFVMGSPSWKEDYQKLYDELLMVYEQGITPHLSIYNI